MAPGPTDLEAWEALQAYAFELDKVRRPKELKEAMHNVVRRSWNMSESRLDFVDFGIIWIDPHFRQICNKYAEIGPGRETFDMATYRTLKTSRLEGYWDVLLENLADWIGAFAKGFRRSVTLDDYERLLSCLPPDRNLKTYRINLKNLFWPAAGQRAGGFLSQFTAAAYEDAFTTVLTHPPDEGWNLKLIMNQIHDKGIVCKSVMLHVGFWFNPDLEEPANRANVKPPMIDHLKPTFSKYDPSHPMYEADESWKPPALELQSVALSFTLQKWPKNNAVIGNLGMLRDMSSQKYGEYVSSDFWNRLLHKVRVSTNAPFRHPSLTRYKRATDLPPIQSDSPQIYGDLDMNELRERARQAIQDDHGNGPTIDSEEGEERLEDKNDSTLPSHYNGGNGLGYVNADSAALEALAVESDDDGDIIHVQTPSPVHSNASKRQKVHHTNEALGYVPVYDHQYSLSQKPQTKLIKLKMPQEGHNDQTSQILVERPLDLAKKRPVTHNIQLPDPVPEPSPTLTAPSNPHSRATPVMITQGPGTDPQQKDTPQPTLEQQSSAGHVSNVEHNTPRSEPAPQVSEDAESKRETARRALDKYESSTKPPKSQVQQPIERLSSLDQPFPQLPKYNPATANRILTPTAPTPSPAPPSLSHQSSFFAQTPSAASPALLSTNKTEQAILILQDEFGDTLQIAEMLAAIKLLKNDLEAGIFLTLKPGALRNAWLWDGIKDDIRAL